MCCDEVYAHAGLQEGNLTPGDVHLCDPIPSFVGELVSDSFSLQRLACLMDSARLPIHGQPQPARFICW